MKPQERSKLRDQENIEDDEVAGAILRSHHVAIGMSKNEQDSFRIAWQRRKFPGQADKLSRLDRALRHIERAEIVDDVPRMRTQSMLAIKNALEAGGIVFVEGDHIAGPGVRLRRK